MGAKLLFNKKSPQQFPVYFFIFYWKSPGLKLAVLRRFIYYMNNSTNVRFSFIVGKINGVYGCLLYTLLYYIIL